MLYHYSWFAARVRVCHQQAVVQSSNEAYVRIRHKDYHRLRRIIPNTGREAQFYVTVGDACTTIIGNVLSRPTKLPAFILKDVIICSTRNFDKKDLRYLDFRRYEFGVRQLDDNASNRHKDRLKKALTKRKAKRV